MEKLIIPIAQKSKFSTRNYRESEYHVSFLAGGTHCVLRLIFIMAAVCLSWFIQQKCSHNIYSCTLISRLVTTIVYNHWPIITVMLNDLSVKVRIFSNQKLVSYQLKESVLERGFISCPIAMWLIPMVSYIKKRSSLIPSKESKMFTIFSKGCFQNELNCI